MASSCMVHGRSEMACRDLIRGRGATSCLTQPHPPLHSPGNDQGVQAGTNY